MLFGIETHGSCRLEQSVHVLVWAGERQLPLVGRSSDQLSTSALYRGHGCPNFVAAPELALVGR